MDMDMDMDLHQQKSSISKLNQIECINQARRTHDVPELVHDWRFALEKWTNGDFSNINGTVIVHEMRYDINMDVNGSPNTRKGRTDRHMCI